jgi:hypothetical protein
MRGKSSPVVERSHTNCSSNSCWETDSSTVGLSEGEAVGPDVLEILAALEAVLLNVWRERCWRVRSRAD